MKQIKFILAVLVILTTFVVVACKEEEKDEDELFDEMMQKIDEEMLLGTWKSVTITYTENGKEYTANCDDQMYVLWTFAQSTATFKSYTNGALKESIKFSYTIKGNKLIDKDGGEIIFEVEGDVLTLESYDEGEKIVYNLNRQP